jgi:hypothetical protein
LSVFSSILWLFGAVILFTICAISWILVKKQRRAKRMSEAALRLGFSYQKDDRGFLQEGASEIPLFRLAALGQFELTNLMKGRAGAYSAAICDYHYWTGSGGTGQRFDYEQTVFCFEMKRGRLPDFTLVPQMNVADRKMVALGLKVNKIPVAMFGPLMGRAQAKLFKTVMAATEDKGIEFADHPEFSARYRLQASEAEAVRSIFRAGVIEVFERQQPPLPSVAKAGNWFVVYRKNVLVKPADLGDALNEAASIRTLFPQDA